MFEFKTTPKCFNKLAIKYLATYATMTLINSSLIDFFQFVEFGEKEFEQIGRHANGTLHLYTSFGF